LCKSAEHLHCHQNYDVSQLPCARPLSALPADHCRCL
jgi:hypothetical protein